ncbi:helix-turn-helix domain-containing protein [Azonexus caeni]|jgi:excisionase family DNA binding protein|uniref:helix-turn-helix domain-containing protein n=1 Tax=Azonexus caeni TaxID=266126 RepID=UPI003A84CA5A
MATTQHHDAELLTIVEASSFLRISRAKLYQLIGGGAIRVVRFGKRSTRVPRSEVVRFASIGIQ